MSEVIGEAFVEIRPIAERFEGEARQLVNTAMAQLQSGPVTGVEIGPRLAPSFRAEAQAQIERATAGIRSAVTVDPRLAPSFRAITQAEVARATANIRTVARVDPLVAPSFRAVSRQEVAQAAAGLTAAATITPRLDPSFRQQAQAQLDSASAGLTEPQRFFASQQTNRELGLSGSVAETEALKAAFKQLELTGVASATNIAAAAVEVRTALGLTSAEGVAAQERLAAAALGSAEAIGATGVAAQEAAQLQIAAQKQVQAVAVAPVVPLSLGQQAGQRSRGIQSQIANLAALKQQGLLTESAITGTQRAITDLDTSIGDLQAMRGSASAGVVAQLDAQLAALTQESAGAKAGLREILSPIEKVEQASAKAAVATNKLSGARNVFASAASSAGLNSVALRYGVVGAAALTAFQGVHAVSEGLKTEGEEAFTTTGRMRNFGASLLSLDVAGAVAGAGAMAKSLDEAGISAVEAANHYAEFKRIAEGDSPFKDIAQQAVDQTNELRNAEHAADAYADAIAGIGVAFEAANREGERFGALRFGGPGTSPDSAGGLRGPGAVDQINTNLGANRAAPTFANPVEIGPTARNRNAQVIAAARGDLEELLRLRNVEVERLTKAVANSHGNRQQRIALNSDLASAQADVITTQKAIDDKNAADAKAASSAREAAAQAAATAAANARTATETNLQNEVAKAALTARKTDDIRTTAALIEYLKTVRDNTDLEATERADARKKITAARANLQRVLKPESGADTERQIAEARLANNLAAAALTEGRADDRKAIQAQITYYQGLVGEVAKVETARKQFVLANAKGLVQKGNLDILHRPDVRNPDGTHSSVLTTSFGTDQGEVLVPRVLGKGKNARVVSEAEALRHFQETGEHLGIFNTIKAANAYAKLLHEQQASLIKQQPQLRGLELEQARGRLIASKALLAGLPAGDPLREQRLANQRARAELTKGTGDNRKAINDSIAYWKEQKEGATALRKAQIENTLIGLRGDLKGLSEPDAGDKGTTVFDLLTSAAQRFNQIGGNLIGKDQPFSGPTGFTADLAQFLKREGGPPGAGSRSRATAIADPELIRALRENTQAIRESSRGDGDRRPGAGARPPGSGALERNDQRFWQAQQARTAADAGLSAAGAGI